MYRLLTSLCLFLCLAPRGLAQLSVDFSNSKSGGCSPLVVTFTPTLYGSSAGATYQWDLGNGNTSTTANPQAIYTTVGTYTVTLTVSSGGRSASASHPVTVYASPTAGFAASANLVCSTPVTFTSNSQAGDGSYLTGWLWDFGDGSTQNASSTVTHPYTTVGTMTVSLTVSDNHGCTASATQSNLIKVLPPLTAGFTSDKQVLCNVSDPVQFTNSSTGPGTLTYSWDFGDGTTSTQPNPGHSYSQKGNYPVKLTVTNSDGCVATANQATPLNVANYHTDFNAPATGACQNSSLTFTDVSQPSPTTRTWLIDGSPYSYYNPLTYTFPSPGTHTITLANTYGTCPQQTSKTVDIKPLPPAIPFTTVLAGACGAPVTATLTANPTGGGAYTYDWIYNYTYVYGNPSETNSGSNPTTTHTFTTNDAYTVQLTATDANGCKSTTSKNIIIQAPNVQIYEPAPGTSSNSCNQPITKTLAFYPPTTPLTGINWDFGDGTHSADPNPTHTWTQPGQYIVQLYYTDANGCNGVSGNRIYVIISPPVNIDFTATPTTACAGSTISFSSPSATALNPLYSTWSFGDGSQWFATGAIHTYANPGVYDVTFYVQTIGGCSQTVTKTGYITILPTPGQYTGYTNTCDGDRSVVTFTYNQAGATSINWDFGDGSTQVTAGNIGQVQHSYPRTGTYYPNITGTNGTCSSQKSDAVYVLKKQSPVLSAASNTVCANGTLAVSLAMERNPREAGTGYYYDYTPQFFYGDGTPFAGTTTLTNTYNGYLNGAFQYTLSGFQAGKSGLYVSTKSFGFNCSDLSNTMPLTIQGSATAAMTVSGNIQCFHNAVTFKDASTVGPANSIVNWTWDFGDGTTQSLNQSGTFTHVYAHPGNYTARLTVQDQGGCSSSSGSGVTNVQVNGPEPNFSYSPSRVLLGNTVYFANLTNTIGASGTTYTWDFGDGSGSTAANPSHLYTAPGIYTVTLTAKGGTVNTCSLTTTQTIVVNYFNSHFQISPLYVSNGTCPPVLAQFVNTSVNYSSVTWDFGDGTGAGNINYPSHVYTKPGGYQVTLSVYGSGGLIAQYTDSVFVRQPSASLTAVTPAVCVGQPTQLQAKAKGALNFVFDYGDGSVSNGLDSGVTHQYAKSGDYTAQLVVTDTVGCSVAANANVAVRVNPLPIIGVASSDPHVCLGSGIVLTATGASTYVWTPATSLDNPSSSSPTASPTVNTTYNVSATDANGCQGQGSIDLKVVMPQTLSVSPDSTGLCLGDTVALHAKGTDVVQWIGDVAGLNSVSSDNPLASPPQTVHYKVVGSDAYACFSDTAAITLTVLPLPTVNGGDDVEVLAGTPVTLAATGSSDIVQWQWTPAVFLSCTDCEQPICTPKKPTTYMVTVTNGVGCHARDTVQAKLLCEEAYVRIPEAFSPNGDGKNDRFGVLGIGLVDHMVIFDRWGEKVFDRSHFFTADADGQWDGKFRGQPAPTGTYVYFVEMSCPSGGVFTRRGTVVLVR